jgi:hypothetical protein
VKLVALWAALVVIAVTAAGSCSISHRSGDFACDDTHACATGRTCTDGFCVTAQQPDAGVPIDGRIAIDAPIPIDGPPQPMCPAQCTSCDLDAKTCAVDCSADPNLCQKAITCPAGFSCKIDCTSGGSCRQAIDCGDAADCTITCGVSQSCRDVTCGGGACNLECRGFGSCASVTGGSGTLTETCTGPTSCTSVTCGSGACTIGCSGSTSCADVVCGAGRCGVECTGNGSCSSADCKDACACDVTCGPSSSCGNVSCPFVPAFPNCNVDPVGCTSQQRGCDTCQ